MVKKRAAKKVEATTELEPRYEIMLLGAWHRVDRGNVLRDGCLHWQIGEEYGMREKGKWRVAKG